mmetsp:Transcript_11889/g.27721  ORF Transcript_11889/g.27721 Transcript_11889/m.27721 type:complete len:476 (-) Transcript_11889:410-1837(-)
MMKVAVASQLLFFSTTVAATCPITANYPECSAPVASSQRVRREIRSLSAADWDAVVAAMWTMKNETMSSGISKYGSAFRSYDYFVVKHAVAQTDTRGDQAHFGAHFMTWHSALVLEFENAMLAVDPSIGALPYWDETITEPSVFSADYFGTDPGAGTEYQVTSGRFADWPILSNFNLADWADHIVDDSTVSFAGNPSGLLRSAVNLDGSQFATRYGSGVSWESGAMSADAWWQCTTGSSYTSWEEWYWCIENPQDGEQSMHSGPHAIVGGQSGDNRGDFEDPVTSPNAAIFMFHHANMDRSKMWWMLAHSDLSCSYYDFPLTDGGVTEPGSGTGGTGRPSGPQGGGGRRLQGFNLNDVASSSWGFTSEDLGLEASGSGDSTPAGQLTHADLLCWMAPGTAVYTYDTHVQCLTDANSCNAVQVLGRPEAVNESSSTTAFQDEADVPSAAASSVGSSYNFIFVLLLAVVPLLTTCCN